MKIISASSPGKIILFGEHAVVWGYPAIAMAIPIRTECIVEEIFENKIQIYLKDYNIYLEYKTLEDLIQNIPAKFHQFSEGLTLIKKLYNGKINNIKITLTSNLIPSAGLGSSASSAVAFISALGTFFNSNLDKEKINQLTFKMEEIIHGKPSGIDDKVCIYANIIFYQEGNFHYINVPIDFNLLITYSNVKHDTGKVINNIEKLKSEKPILCDLIFDKIGFYTEIAELELTTGNLIEVGRLMNINQTLLENLNLTTPQISEIIQIARNNGAFGSKITGAGLGGCVITLGEIRDLEKIMNLLKEKGYSSFLTKIDRDGIIIKKGN
jgi:mevalonate kinase